jgi:hypothetical protein
MGNSPSYLRCRRCIQANPGDRESNYAPKVSGHPFAATGEAVSAEPIVPRYDVLVTLHTKHGEITFIAPTYLDAVAYRRRIGENGVRSVTVAYVRRLGAVRFTAPDRRTTVLPYETSADSVAKSLADGLTGTDLLAILADFEFTRIEPVTPGAPTFAGIE